MPARVEGGAHLKVHLIRECVVAGVLVRGRDGTVPRRAQAQHLRRPVLVSTHARARAIRI